MGGPQAACVCTHLMPAHQEVGKNYSACSLELTGKVLGVGFGDELLNLTLSPYLNPSPICAPFQFQPTRRLR